MWLSVKKLIRVLIPDFNKTTFCYTMSHSQVATQVQQRFRGTRLYLYVLYTTNLLKTVHNTVNTPWYTVW